MLERVSLVLLAPLLLALAAACSSGSGDRATPTPSVPGPEQVIGDWVRQNRNVDFVGDCSSAKPGVDVGKLCVGQIGERGTRRAYSMGPTFSEGTATAIVERQADGTWKLLSVTNNDPSAGNVPGIDWPLEVGDQIVVIGLGEGDCLRIRELPSQQGKQLQCVPDGTKAIVQEGPVDAETFRWWRVSGEFAGGGFNGWAAGKWMRLPEAIAQALQPQATATPQ